MGYGSRKYGHKKIDSPLPAPAVPTHICNHCGKIKQITHKTITLTGAVNNAVFLTGRICDDCGILLKDWLKGK